MRKIFLTLIITFFMAYTPNVWGYYADVSIKVGAYFPSYHKMRRVFPVGSPYSQLEVAGHFGHPWEYIPWQVWATVGYLPGTTSKYNIERARFFPIALGLKYIWYVLDGGEFSLGVGGVAAWLRLKDEGAIPRKYVSKKNLGTLLRMGVKYWFSCEFFGEFFVDYLIMNFHTKPRPFSQLPHRLDMNGAIIGGGLGIKF